MSLEDDLRKRSKSKPVNVEKELEQQRFELGVESAVKDLIIYCKRAAERGKRSIYTPQYWDDHPEIFESYREAEKHAEAVVERLREEGLSNVSYKIAVPTSIFSEREYHVYFKIKW
ncbi:MAG: hypothetical protein J5493_08085 [Lachnospiraceae bacterium]|nr:hypothetical protein [Lachnospiraceae bacterium]